MNEEKAQRLIVILTFVTLGSTVGYTLRPPKGAKEELKIHRIIAGGFFAMAISSVLADIDTTLGVGLAVLVSGGAFLKYGLPVVEEEFGSGTLKEKFPQKKGAKGLENELKQIPNPPVTFPLRK